MCDIPIKDLRASLGKLTRVIKKEENQFEETTLLELKEIIQDIVSLSSNIDSFAECLKAKKNPKAYEKLKQQQERHERLFKQFMPIIIAYDIIMAQDQENSRVPELS